MDTRKDRSKPFNGHSYSVMGTDETHPLRLLENVPHGTVEIYLPKVLTVHYCLLRNLQPPGALGTYYAANQPPRHFIREYNC